MLYEIFLIYLLTGALSGFVSGLFGVVGDLNPMRGLSLRFHGVQTGITGSLLGSGPAIVIGPYMHKLRYSMPMIVATASALPSLLGFSAMAG